MTFPRLNPLLHNCHHWREIDRPKRVIIQVKWISRPKPVFSNTSTHLHKNQVAITELDWLASIPDVSFLKHWSIEVLQIIKNVKMHGKTSITSQVDVWFGWILTQVVALDVCYNPSHTIVLIQPLLPKAFASETQIIEKSENAMKNLNNFMSLCLI